MHYSFEQVFGKASFFIHINSELNVLKTTLHSTRIYIKAPFWFGNLKLRAKIKHIYKCWNVWRIYTYTLSGCLFQTLCMHRTRGFGNMLFGFHRSEPVPAASTMTFKSNGKTRPRYLLWCFTVLQVPENSIGTFWLCQAFTPLQFLAQIKCLIVHYKVH